MIQYDESDRWYPKDADEVYEMQDAFEAYKERIAEVARRYTLIVKGRDASPDMDETQIELGGGKIHLDWTERHHCGGYERQHLEFPIRYLFEKDWQEKLIEELKQAKLEEARKEKLEKDAKRKAEEERKRSKDYQQYLALKAKFGEDA